MIVHVEQCRRLTEEFNEPFVTQLLVAFDFPLLITRKFGIHLI
jgi:hypothetical protein